MELDLSYLPQEDRMRLSLRGQADWLVTRSLLLRLLPVWVEKLESIALPAVGIPLGPRNLKQEHALSLEFVYSEVNLDKQYVCIWLSRREACGLRTIEL